MYLRFHVVTDVLRIEPYIERKDHKTGYIYLHQFENNWLKVGHTADANHYYESRGSHQGRFESRIVLSKISDPILHASRGFERILHGSKLLKQHRARHGGGRGKMESETYCGISVETMEAWIRFHFGDFNMEVEEIVLSYFLKRQALQTAETLLGPPLNGVMTTSSVKSPPLIPPVEGSLIVPVCIVHTFIDRGRLSSFFSYLESVSSVRAIVRQLKDLILEQIKATSRSDIHIPPPYDETKWKELFDYHYGNYTRGRGLGRNTTESFKQKKAALALLAGINI